MTAHTEMTPRTIVSIQGEKFLNGVPTYPGRIWNGHPVEGLFMNSRMVQGIFDDLNPENAGRWAYVDTQEWDVSFQTNANTPVSMAGSILAENDCKVVMASLQERVRCSGSS